MMTLDDLRQLSLSDRDRMAAEKVMGWTARGTKWVDDVGWTGYVTNPLRHYDDNSWHPSDNLGQVHCVEAKAIELVAKRCGLAPEYVEFNTWYPALTQVIADSHCRHASGCLCARATAEQRVLACLLAVGGGE